MWKKYKYFIRLDFLISNKNIIKTVVSSRLGIENYDIMTFEKKRPTDLSLSKPLCRTLLAIAVWTPSNEEIWCGSESGSRTIFLYSIRGVSIVVLYAVYGSCRQQYIKIWWLIIFSLRFRWSLHLQHI